MFPTRAVLLAPRGWGGGAPGRVRFGLCRDVHCVGMQCVSSTEAVWGAFKRRGVSERED